MIHWGLPLALALQPAAAFAQTATSAPSSVTIQPPSNPAATSAAIDRFYAERSGAPLWLRGGRPSEAAQLLLARLRTANFDGLAEGPALAGKIDRLLANPETTPAADWQLSSAFLALTERLHGPLPGLVYADSAARPLVEPAARMLYLAGQSTMLAAHVGAVLRMSRLYEELRAATLADATAKGGLVDPRLLANLQRARALPSTGRYLVVNPAVAELMMVDNGEVVDRMRVVVGTAQTPTAPMASAISYATVNPYWNVPEDLVRKILAPRVVTQGLSYLKRGHYQAVDSFGADAKVIAPETIDWKAVKAGTAQVKLRQQPGPYNSMGLIKFGFPNAYGIYLHDEPSKAQFAKPGRALSNGCVRLPDAPRLARWLLGHDPVAVGVAGDQHLALPKPMPIYITYLTAQPGAGGAMLWAADVYGLDGAAATRLSAN
ncbi:MAG: L,D-transpeptidase family protein [Sphingomicrobium sp.]